MSSSRTPCAACKTLRRKCTNNCPFAPYFPPEQAYKFDVVHKVYGASTVARILSEVSPSERVEAVTSLVYEAEARLKDPIYGCVGSVSILQHKLKQIQNQLDTAKQELASYIGPSAMMQVLNQRVEARKDQDMLRNLENQHQHQQQSMMGLLSFNSHFDGAGPSGHAGAGAMAHVKQQQQHEEQFRHLQQIQQHQVMVQQQNQQWRVQPHVQQEQRDAVQLSQQQNRPF